MEREIENLTFHSAERKVNLHNLKERTLNSSVMSSSSSFQNEKNVSSFKKGKIVR